MREWSKKERTEKKVTKNKCSFFRNKMTQVWWEFLQILHGNIHLCVIGCQGKIKLMLSIRDTT